MTVPLKLSQSSSEGGWLAVRDSEYCTKLLSCAITPQRTVLCWSPNLSKQLPVTNITQLVAGDRFHCALDAKGKVVARADGDARRKVPTK